MCNMQEKDTKSKDFFSSEQLLKGWSSPLLRQGRLWREEDCGLGSEDKFEHVNLRYSLDIQT